MCNVCLAERTAVTRGGEARGMLCEQGTFVCGNCLPQLAISATERSIADIDVQEHGTEWPVHAPSGPPYPRATLMAALKQGAKSAPLSVRDDYRDAIEALRAADSALAELACLHESKQSLSAAEFELRCVRAHYRKPDGTFGAHMCKRCGFGPVDHHACDDLVAHHHEVHWRGWRRTRIQNGCPHCGWFARDISAWPAWDGERLGAARPKAHHRLTRAVGSAAPTSKTLKREAIAVAVVAAAVVTSPIWLPALGLKKCYKWRTRRARNNRTFEEEIRSIEEEIRAIDEACAAADAAEAAGTARGAEVVDAAEVDAYIAAVAAEHDTEYRPRDALAAYIRFGRQFNRRPSSPQVQSSAAAFLAAWEAESGGRGREADEVDGVDEGWRERYELFGDWSAAYEDE